MRLGDLDALMHRFMDKPPEYYHTSYIVGEINIAPTVDAVPVKHGRWIEIVTEDAYDIAGIKTWALRARCSECGFVMKFIEAHTGQYIYCPNCGAKMDGERMINAPQD